MAEPADPDAVVSALDVGPTPFDVCWHRLLRADAHDAALAQAWNAFIARDPFEFVTQMDANGEGALWVQRTQPWPIELSIYLGEFLYQLRAALDACVYELACVNGGRRPPANKAQLEFPIRRSKETFDKDRWKIAPLTDQQRAIVESIQPYHVPPDLPHYQLAHQLSRSLGILNDWARIDRHRQLHVVSAWAGTATLALSASHGATISDLSVRERFVLTDINKVASFRVLGGGGEVRVEGKSGLPFEIGVNEPPLPCHPIETFEFRLKRMKLAVGAAIRKLSQTVGIDPVAQPRVDG